MTRINTPLRRLTAVFLVAFALVCFAPAAHALDDPNIQAAAAFLADPITGQVLYEKNADERRFPASTTKIMTALLTLENASLEDTVTATAADFALLEPGSSLAGIKLGETLTVHDLLYGLMLPSGNDAAIMLARHVGGSVENFVQMMNDKAIALGCTGTHFVNSSGLHHADHYSTARDLFTISSAAMKNETFAEIVNTAQKTLQATNLQPQRKVFTSNLLTLRKTNPTYYRYCKGIKTGHTSQSGYCFVGTATKKESTLISVVLGCEGQSNATALSFTETRRLFEWGFDNFAARTLVEKELPMVDLAVDLSTDTDHVVLQTRSELIAVVPIDLDLSDLTMKQNIPERVTAPIKAGDVLGSIEVSYGDTTYGTIDLVALNDVSLSRVLYYADKLENFFRGTIFKYIVAGLALVLGLFILIRSIRIARRGRKKQHKMRNRYRNFK